MEKAPLLVDRRRETNWIESADQLLNPRSSLGFNNGMRSRTDLKRDPLKRTREWECYASRVSRTSLATRLDRPRSGPIGRVGKITVLAWFCGHPKFGCPFVGGLEGGGIHFICYFISFFPALRVITTQSKMILSSVHDGPGALRGLEKKILHKESYMTRWWCHLPHTNSFTMT